MISFREFPGTVLKVLPKDIPPSPRTFAGLLGWTLGNGPRLQSNAPKTLQIIDTGTGDLACNK